jgi:hypothetical protein
MDLILAPGVHECVTDSKELAPDQPIVRYMAKDLKRVQDVEHVGRPSFVSLYQIGKSERKHNLASPCSTQSFLFANPNVYDPRGAELAVQ